MIVINCTGSDTIQLHELTEFQGELKERESAGGHATPKPVALCERAIKRSSRERETVLDFFGGSGSTLIAAEKNNRKALLIELEPKWCDVIRKRWTKWAKENGRKVGSGGLE